MRRGQRSHPLLELLQLSLPLKRMAKKNKKSYFFKHCWYEEVLWGQILQRVKSRSLLEFNMQVVQDRALMRSWVECCYQ